ncbi:PI4KA [Cordylochernes scorpioides]|uniref:PI4KA n=1 Tax=Cordylochernes scorpioides TaxID=51811 RepID=A0ABY6LDI7_9ARAC|nr:PI4KA [Cordylochernes scorpioides]
MFSMSGYIGEYCVCSVTLCKVYVPLTLGTARALGRGTTSTPLFLRIFPSHSAPEDAKNYPVSSPGANGASTKRRIFHNFKPIMQRSMSHNVLGNTEPGSPLESLPLATLPPYNPTSYFFYKFGSSFGRLPALGIMGPPDKDKNPLTFSITHLQTVLALVGHPPFIVGFLPNLPCPDLPPPFTRDVQDFVRGLFLSGQTELQSKQHDASEREDRENNFATVNKFKVNVQTNAACVDLLVWAVVDDVGKFG